MATLSLLVAALSLGVSIATAWFTQLRRGRLAMTQPSLVYVGFDQSSSLDRPAKLYLRMLLYSTAVRGQVVERIYVRLGHEGGERVTFGFWAYADREAMVPGSGLYVPAQGVVMNHHFVLGAERRDYRFLAGKHTIAVYAKGVRARPTKLGEVELAITEEQETALGNGAGVLFSSAPESSRYFGQAEYLRP